MILCPSCRHNEIIGTLFCSECGTQLITSGNLTTQSIHPSSTDLLHQSEENAPSILGSAAKELVNTALSIHLLDSGEVIYLSGKLEYSIGRATDGQPILPDVDLSPYDGYAQGVSRLHASIKVMEHGIVVTDLGSSNGTRVNGQKIVSHVDYPLNHGDVIALGKFKIQVLLYNQRSKSLV